MEKVEKVNKLHSKSDVITDDEDYLSGKKMSKEDKKKHLETLVP